MIIDKKNGALGLFIMMVFNLAGMETSSSKSKKWYEHIDILVYLFGQQNIQGRPRQMHRDSSEKTVPQIDQMAHVSLFTAISKNDLNAVKNIYSENNVVDINYRENKKKQTLLIAALMNLKKQKENNDLCEVKKAQDIIGVMCDPSHSVSMNMKLLKKAQLLAKKIADEYQIPELNRALELIVDNKKAASIMKDNATKMNDPEKWKEYEKLTGLREDSFLLAAKLKKKNEAENEVHLADGKNESEESIK